MAEHALPRRILHEALTLHRAGFAPGRALHNAIGGGLPLAIGVATDHTLEGVAVAGGALVVGFVDLGTPYSARAQAMLVASVTVAASTLVGLVTGDNDWLTVALMALWGFGGGLAAVLGQAAAFVGLSSALALLLAADFPTDAGEAARRAALVLAGGLLQTLLALVIWPLRPARPERKAVAAASRALADFADDWPGGDASAFVSAAGAAEAMLAGHRSWAPGGSIVDSLTAVANDLEGIYGRLAELRTERAGLSDVETAEVDGVVASAAATLRTVATGVEGGRLPAEAEAAADDSPHTPWVEPLARRLQRIVRVAASLAEHRRGIGQAEQHPAPPPPRTAALAVLRANLSLQSTAFRHAVRLGTTLAVAVAIYRIFPLGRGYWVPLTVVFVLRPDFGATFTRGLQRYAGTVVGVGLASALAAALNPGDWADTILVTAFAWAAFAMFFANYAVFTASITAMIVFFVSYEGSDTYTAVVDRFVDTLIGGALAMAAMLLWPTWEGTDRVRTRVADLLDAAQALIRAVLREATDAAAADRGAVQDRRLAVRLARSNAEASLERALAEPARAGENVATSADVMLASRAIVDAALAIDARLADEPDRAALPELAETAAELDRTLEALAAAQRSGSGPPATPVEAARIPAAVPPWLRLELERLNDAAAGIEGLLDEEDRLTPGAADRRSRALRRYPAG